MVALRQERLTRRRVVQPRAGRERMPLVDRSLAGHGREDRRVERLGESRERSAARAASGYDDGPLGVAKRGSGVL